jgi:hypothetical protein
MGQATSKARTLHNHRCENLGSYTITCINMIIVPNLEVYLANLK